MGDAKYLAAVMEESGKDSLEWLSVVGGQVKTNRVTLIAESGRVLYDSISDINILANHGSRPEVRAAWEKGEGEALRTSATLAEQTYYYAVRMSDNSVLRVSTISDSAWFSLLSLVPQLAIALIIIFGLVMTLAERQTRTIIGPINAMDLDRPEVNDVYEELSPLIDRLKNQNRTIDKQVSLLMKKQREFTAITEHMSEGLLVLDSRGEVISYNSSALKILGVDKKTLEDAGNHILKFNRSSTFRYIIDTAQSGEPAEKTMEFNGRYYQILANPVAEYREHWGTVVVFLDVTEKKNRDELRREFSANVSHELKTPLTSISGYAEIMKNGLVKSEDMIHFSDNIYKEAQRLIILVEDIIKISRLDEQGEVATLEKEPVDLYMLAGEVIKRLAGKAAGCEVVLSLEGQMVEIEGARQILDEMIYNICDNAIKYNVPGGSVKVTVFSRGDQAAVVVKDSGIGIPAGEQERIFERFYRVDKSHSQQIGGTGLGLSIVKYGAKYHNASVELTSRQNKGTTVKLIFPVQHNAEMMCLK